MKKRFLFKSTDNKIVNGLLHAALQDNEVGVWQHGLPAYDIFDMYNPNVLICSKNDLGPELSSVLSEYNDVEVFSVGREIDENSFRANNEFEHKPVKNKSIDILYYTSKSKVDASKIYPYLFPNTDLNIKVVGDISIDSPLYLGKVSQVELFWLAQEAALTIDTSNEEKWNIIRAGSVFSSSIEDIDYDILTEIGEKQQQEFNQGKYTYRDLLCELNLV